MTSELPLEQMIGDWLAQEAESVPPPPWMADEAIATTAAMKPLPGWIAMIREPAMTSRRRAVVGVPRRQLVAIALVLALVASAIGVGAWLLLRPTQTVESWPGYRGDATRTSLARSGPAGHPVIRWQASLDAGVENDLAIANGLVLVPTSDGVLHAMAEADGREVWRFSAPAPMKGPVASEDRVFVADGDGVIHALVLAGGREIWQFRTALVTPSDLAVTGGGVFVGTGDGQLVAIDAGSGAEQWRRAITGAAVHAPALAHDVVLVATDDAVFAAFDASTGAELWRRDIGDGPVGNPVATTDTAYLGGGATTPGARLVAVDLRTGQSRWEIDQNLYSPSTSGTTGYTGSSDGLMTAIELPTGHLSWTASFRGIVRAPVIAGDVIYIAADGERRLVALRAASGEQLWTLPVDGQISCCIAVANRTLFAGTVAGTVYAIAGDGQQLATAPRPSAPETAAPGPSGSQSAPSAEPLAVLSTRLLWAATSGKPDFIPWSLTAAPDGRLWATEANSDRFSIFTKDGRFVESWGSSGSTLGSFDLTGLHDNPYGAIAFEADGSFFVLDVGNSRVQRFDRDRNLLGWWGSFGREPGQFQNPVGIAIDADGHVNILDDVRGVIETYDLEGRVLRTIPAFPAEISPNDGANQLAIGPNGDLFLAMAGPVLVAELRPDGSFVRTFGGPGTGAGALTEQPDGLAWDAAGHLYVTSGPNTTQPGVMIYDVDGTALGGFGLRGAARDELGFPWGIVVNTDGVYVADAGALPEYGLSSYIRKFSPVLPQGVIEPLIDHRGTVDDGPPRPHRSVARQRVIRSIRRYLVAGRASLQAGPARYAA